MINRRSFLHSIPHLSFLFLLASCSKISPQVLNLIFLKGSLPPQLITQFRKELKAQIQVNFQQAESLEDIFKLLKNSSEKYQGDLFTLGNYWLEELIKQDLIEPFNVAELNQWRNFIKPLKDLIKVKQNQNQKERIWGIPYRWGTTVIAYHKDLLAEKNILPPTDWQDLWRKDFSQQIGLLNQPREIIGLTLKKLGYSYNTPDLHKITNLKSELIKLNQQVKFYSSNYYLQPLILGDVSVIVGWSEDILPIKKDYPYIDVIIPPSGTSLWAEMWVQPKRNQSLNSEKKELIKQWIDFCWQGNSASQIALFTSATSPIISMLNPDEIPTDILNNSLLNINPEILKKSEFINHLEPTSEKQYLDLWSSVMGN